MRSGANDDHATNDYICHYTGGQIGGEITMETVHDIFCLLEYLFRLPHVIVGMGRSKLGWLGPARLDLGKTSMFGIAYGARNDKIYH